MRRLIASLCCLVASCVSAIAAEGSRPGACGGPPTITSISQAIGTTDGGTPVVLTGTNFGNAFAVNFGSVSAGRQWWINNQNSITVSSPAGSAATVDIRVTSPCGQSATSSADQFTYVTPSLTPTILAVTANTGDAAGGDKVTIVGTNFSNTSLVTFGATSASFSIDSDSGLEVVVPAGTNGQTVHINVTSGGRNSTNSNSDLFTYGSPTVLPIPIHATRPPYNVGNGFFVVGRGIYDANGNLFTPYGANHSHFDAATLDRFLAKGNIERNIPYFDGPNGGWTGSAQKGLEDETISYKVVPLATSFWLGWQPPCLTMCTSSIVADANVTAGGSGYGSGATVPVTFGAPPTGGTQATGFGNLVGGVLQSITMTNLGGGYTTTPSVTIGGSGTGAAATADLQSYPGLNVTGLVDIPDLQNAYAPWLNATIASNWQSAYSNIMWMSPANEWGRCATLDVRSGGTGTYRTGNIGAVTDLRNAGYTVPIVIDAGCSGQGPDNFTADAVAIEAADPLHNVIFAWHVYNNVYNVHTDAGEWGFVATAGMLAQMTVPVIIEEFGAIGASACVTGSSVVPDTLLSTTESYQMGWIAWAYDDPACNILGQSMTTGAWCYALRSSFGDDIINTASIGMKAVAVRATVFSGSPPTPPACM